DEKSTAISGRIPRRLSQLPEGGGQVARRPCAPLRKGRNAGARGADGRLLHSVGKARFGRGRRPPVSDSQRPETLPRTGQDLTQAPVIVLSRNQGFWPGNARKIRKWYTEPPP